MKSNLALAPVEDIEVVDKRLIDEHPPFKRILWFVSLLSVSRYA